MIRRMRHSRIFNGLTLGLVTLFCFSCENYLQDVRPGSSLPLDSGLDNLHSLETFLSGTYSELAGWADIRMVAVPEMQTEDTEQNCAGGSFLADFCRNDIQSTNGALSAIWSNGYAVINQASIMIERVDRLSAQGDLAAADANRLAGEAHFLRGLMYFELVRLFALPYHVNSSLGIPIVTTGVDNTDKITFPSRHSVQEVYAQALHDLTVASEMLPRSGGDAGRASHFAAIAYLAEVNFQIAQSSADFEVVANLASSIIESGNYQLLNSPEEFFRNEGNSEEIWSVLYSNQEFGALFELTQGNLSFQFNLALDLVDRVYGKAITDAQRSVLDANGWQVDDRRFSLLTNTDSIDLKSTKYNDPFGGDNAPAMRYAEIILMYAECQARLGDLESAIAYLNMIRKRALVVRNEAGSEVVFSDQENPILFKASDFSSVEDLIEAIILERQVELIMEGNRFHDLIRLGRPVNGIDYQSCRLRCPIPQAEIDANPNLVQNYPTDC